MKNLIIVIASLLVLASCEKQAKQSFATKSETQSKKGGIKASLITAGLPGVVISASESGGIIIWSGLPDTVHVIQLGLCDNNSFADSTYAVANLFLQNPVSSINYPASFTIPSDWFSGTKFVRIQGDYYINSQSGAFVSNVFNVTMP